MSFLKTAFLELCLFKLLKSEISFLAGQSKAEVAGPVAGGVIGAVVVIASVVSAVIFIIRRKSK